MTSFPKTEGVTYLKPPETMPILYVTRDEFRQRAGAAGWDAKTIELFCLPPFTEKCRAVVSREVLKIVPFDQKQPAIA